MQLKIKKEKIIIEKEEKKINLRLVRERDGDVAIKTNFGYFIIRFNQDGTLHRYSSVPKETGFKLDCDGKILLDEEDDEDDC